METIPIYKNKSIANIDGEEWKDVVGFEGLYSVSNIGRVKNIKRNKIRAQFMSKGYLTLIIYNVNSRYTPVHRLVAQAFIPNTENKPQVNHINGIKSDNKTANLEWATCSENQIHSFYVLENKTALINIKRTYEFTTKLKEEEIKYILTKRASGLSVIDIAKEMNVSTSAITRVIKLNNGKYGITVPNNLPRVSHQTAEQIKLSHLLGGKKKAKGVLLYDANNNFIKRFDCKREMMREYGFNRGSVSRCCRGIIKQYKGFIIKDEK